MLVILSQKIDTKSSYEDRLYQVYHYPARYRNQLHEGDIFVYYQGNRQAKDLRYYFGTGIVGKIKSTDGINYYAELLHCHQFAKNVPIHLPSGGYVEQLGYQSVRKSPNPPWQNSVRPLSQEAYNYILNSSGIVPAHMPETAETVDELKEKLKSAVKAFYVDQDLSAIQRIEQLSAKIGQLVLSTET